MTCACDLCEEGFEKNAAGECVEANPCGEGQVSVTNYDSSGKAIGSTCCETKADGESADYNGDGEPDYLNKNYVAVGAIEGTCCAGYQKYKNGDTGPYNVATADYKILVNGNVAYCAKSFSYGSYSYKYITSSKFCRSTGSVTECSCASSGDPYTGEWGNCE